VPIQVPTGLADCPHELFPPPKSWVSSTFVNLVQYTEMSRCGHFAALEEPELFTKDVVEFVQKVEAK
jgi:pimeloyl-ACP methyl ester carboxylesterase